MGRMAVPCASQLQVTSEVHPFMQDAQDLDVPFPVPAKENDVPPAGLRKQPFPDLVPSPPHDRSVPQPAEKGGEVLEVGVALRHAPPLLGMASYWEFL